ncbi:hypothetical protein PR003_g31106 [Phytophthora rubi]|uniref:Secreted protein n=1 Tax=Phytophthora rubi TaxID=129364 RepID=A0A6A3GW98_9STRA|nr:hypothetical protein PR001_g30165 [Phytophthora rubi]KAE8961437.1 hypothetical protein PR002_g29902 [Phytophthora rubi]KAE9269568.1 hypothetical protein PR003_g31106 [Phytophthora rubi]
MTILMTFFAMLLHKATCNTYLHAVLPRYMVPVCFLPTTPFSRVMSNPVYNMESACMRLHRECGS